MKNFKITAKEDGKEYWISRAMAVAGFIYAIHPKTKEYYFLVGERGPGCPDHVGKLGCVCGYLEDGTRKQEIIRECWEELGFMVDPENVSEWCTIDDPRKDARENVVTRYIIKASWNEITDSLKDGTINNNTFSRGGEMNEVGNILFIPEHEIGNYSWAFNHGEILKQLTEKLKRERKFWWKLRQAWKILWS